MRVTVVIVCYNNQDTIADAIESIRLQDYENKQVIVVNDGSTDESLNIIKQERDKSNCFVEGFSLERRMGAAFCKNLVVKQLWENTNSFLFLKPTDRVLPYSLARFAHYVDDPKRVGLVYADEFYEDKDRRLSRIYKSSLIPESAAIGGNFLVTKSGFEQAGEFKEVPNSDADFVNRLIVNKVAIHIPEVLICTRSA